MEVDEMKTHKHHGVIRSDGKLRSHPVTRKHSNKKVQAWHNVEVGAKTVKDEIVSKSKDIAKKTVKFVRSVMCPVDEDGYIHIDLTQVKQKGIRLKFERTEGRKRRIVGLQIEK